MINRLISLELQGYKTFASSTYFEFPSKVTAIVGPNGSGKSNIADAVRWALGEQAFSLLRGKRTEDMIFAGSQQRPKASMAAVSIKFNNEDGWLPVDFSEIVITRRAYRNGENEYLINNQRVRLKEINELLGNSGLGERNYTIIGQGLIDTALSLKAEERRKFIEEAAGIGLYRSRREESIQKLDKTLRNMERARDILMEIKPRLSALAKSKEKNSQYRQIQDELIILFKNWYGYYWHQALKELSQAQLVYQRLLEQYEEAKATISKKEEVPNQIQKNLQENRNQLANLHKLVSNYHLEIEEITKNTAVLEEREKILKVRISEIEKEIEVTDEQKRHQIDELKRLKARAENIHKDLDATRQNFVAAEKLIATRLKEKEAIDREAEKIRQEILIGKSKLLELNTNVSRLEQNIQEKKVEIAEIIQYIQLTEKEILDINHKKDEITNQLEKIRSEYNAQTASAEQLEREVQSIADKVTQLNEEMQDKRTHLSSVAAEIQVLKDAEERLEGFSSGSAMLIKAAKEKKLNSQIFAILQNLEIPQEFEQAISASLGEMLEGIVMEGAEGTEELLQYLEMNNIARTSIFTGRNSRQNDASKIFGGETVVYADTLINNNARASKMIKELLSTTVIVKDRKQALSLYKNLIPGWKLVTMIGEVFDANGIITAGIYHPAQPIQRKRKKRQLENEAESIKCDIELITQQLENSKEGRERIQVELERLIEKAKYNHNLVQEKILEIQKLSIEADQKAKIVENERNRKLNLERTIEILTEQVKSTKLQFEEQERAIEELKKKLDKNATISINSEIEVLRKEFLELSSRKAVAEELETRQNESIQLLHASIERIEQRILDLKKQLTSQRGDLTDTQENKSLLISKYNEISKKIEEINQRIEPLENKVEAIISQHGKIIADINEERKGFALIEGKKTQAQIKVEKLQNQLQILREKARQDFDLISNYQSSAYDCGQNNNFEKFLENLPLIEVLDDAWGDEIDQKKFLLHRLGPINPDIEQEYEEVNERFTFLNAQLQDLEKAESSLRQIIKELDDLMEKKFLQTFIKVNDEFKDIFSQLFNGGNAMLLLTDMENILDSGIEIEATLPGKRKQELAMLSGGERSLTAVALIFALLRISPPPFCILDEVDAMLDESNVVKFGEMLRELSNYTQFIVITHNRNTVQLADVLYGVTMGKDSASQVISLKMDDLTDEMVQ